MKNTYKRINRGFYLFSELTRNEYGMHIINWHDCYTKNGSGFHIKHGRRWKAIKEERIKGSRYRVNHYIMHVGQRLYGKLSDHP